jgi:hypothetical protein
MSDARQLLREVLAAPLKFTREGQTYRFSAPVKTGELIAGAVGIDRRRGTSPTGVAREWTRPVPGEVPAGSGTGKAA